MNNKKKSLVLIDSHVHIHETYDVDIFFDFVFNNFLKYAGKIENVKQWKAFLLLTEMEGVNKFEEIKKLQTVGSEKQFKVENTNENISVKIISAEGNEIFVIAGKQIIAENNIEVLALCTNEKLEEGQDLTTTINKINSVNTVPVLPWGVGKWTGKRKEIITEFLKKQKEEKFFLGDNSGRPAFWKAPHLFTVGNETGHFVLPGTDALSIRDEITKTASYGFYVYEQTDSNNPAKTAKEIIYKLKAPPKTFGALEKFVPFFKNQFTMQMNKRKNKR